MKNLKTIFTIKNIVATISVVFLSWIFFSLVEVITHNAPHQPEYTYSAINFFRVWFGI